MTISKALKATGLTLKKSKLFLVGKICFPLQPKSGIAHLIPGGDVPPLDNDLKNLWQRTSSW